MAQNKTQLRKTYEEIAEHFDATRQKPWSEVEEFLKKLPRAKLILDFGAGNGRHSLLAAERGHEVVALDFSAPLLKIIAAREPKIKLVKGNVSVPPFKKKTFSAILYVATIHHLHSEKERLQSLVEAKKLLKPKGKILISAWAYEQPRFESMPQNIELKWARKWPRFYHLFKKGELEKIVKEASFKIEKAWRSGDNYWVIASKNF